jgi:adenine phosphoribosyltransferase
LTGNDFGTLGSRIDAAIGHVANFPTEGFPFRDITPILEEDPVLFREIVDTMAGEFRAAPPDCVVCIESFGYVFGAPLAYMLKARLVLARRGGKLPRDVYEQGYDMIYARAKTLEIHQSAIRPDDRVLIVDDVLASGGSALAVVTLIQKARASCIGFACVAEVAILRNAPDRVDLETRGFPIVALATL